MNDEWEDPYEDTDEDADEPRINTIFFTVDDELYCLWQHEDSEDFALVQVEGDVILAEGHFCQLAAEVAKLVKM